MRSNEPKVPDQDGRAESPSNSSCPFCVPITAKKASTAVWIGAELLVRESLAKFMGEDKELAVPLIVVGPFEADGQKLPVCCRQLNWVTTSGSTGVPSGLLTTSRKASLAIDPPRGS